MLVTNVKVGDIITCQYPSNKCKSGNMLKNRKGKIEVIGAGTNSKGGPYIKILQEDGTYRTLSNSKIVNLQIVGS